MDYLYKAHSKLLPRDFDVDLDLQDLLYFCPPLDGEDSRMKLISRGNSDAEAGETVE